MEPSPAAVRPPGVPASSGMEPRPEHSFQVLTCTPGTPDWVVVLIVGFFFQQQETWILTIWRLTFVRCSLRGAALCV